MGREWKDRLFDFLVDAASWIILFLFLGGLCAICLI